MKKGLFFIGLLLLCSVMYPQKVLIKDKDSLTPIAAVTLTSNGRAIVSDDWGTADISSFDKKEKIHFTAIGYLGRTIRYEKIAEDNNIIYLTQSGLLLDEVVISGTKWQQGKSRIPFKISSISPDKISIRNPQTAADLIGISGEVFIQKSQLGGGSPMIRGFAANRLFIAVDGIRMNTAIFRSGNLQNIISIDPFVVEKAEVLFGPGSVTYGSDAIGGVMSFYTLTPELSKSRTPVIKGNILGRYSSAANENTGHFDISAGWKKFGMLTSISFNRYDDLKMGSHGPDEYLRRFYVQQFNGIDSVVNNRDPKKQVSTSYDQLSLMQKFRYDGGRNRIVDYGFHYSTTGEYSRYDRLLATRNGFPRSAEWNYGPQRWMMNTLSVSNSIRRRFWDQVTYRFAHQLFEESRIDRDFGKVERRTRKEDVNALSANADFLKTVNPENTFFYGVDLIYNKVHSEGIDKDIRSGTEIKGPSRYPDSDWSSMGVYATYRLTLSDNFLIHAGARYNYFTLNGRFDTSFYPFPFQTIHLNSGAITGSAGFVYDPLPGLTLNANLSTGFRTPNVDDAGKVFDSEPGSVVVPNPGLQPEYVYNAEAGISKMFSSRLKIDLTAFYTRLDKAMVRRNFRFNNSDSIMYSGELSRVQAIQNAANAFVWGMHAAAEIKLGYGISILSRFNIQKGEEELDNGKLDPLRHAAPWYGSTQISWKNQKIRAELNAIYNGEISNDELADEEQGKAYMYAIDSNGKPYSPSWYTLNLMGSYQLNKNILFTCGLENITDQRYRPYSSGIVASGRNFVVSIKKSF